jgi:L-rhamnose-H+ transport protein
MLFPNYLLLLVIVAGAFTGTALLPMKFAAKWKFENIWLLYSICGYLVAPWIVAFVTVPHLKEVYHDAGFTACVLTAISGFGWGLAVVLNGIGVALVGLSLASAILMGSSIALGSLLPILMRDPHQLATLEGLMIVGIDFVMLAGVLLCAWAGRLRGGNDVGEAKGQSATRGILICFIAGALSTLFNVALAYGAIITREAVAHGASHISSANAVWSLAVGAGSLPSILWCMTRLSRERGWAIFKLNFGRNASLCILMGILSITGTVIYGAATGMLGQLGTSIGWPVYMSGIILISNFWGWVTGEWRHVIGRPVYYMLSGITVQIVAILALSRIR